MIDNVSGKNLNEPLTGKDNFYREERAKMIAIGWPMMVSFFCRMGMASTDSAFVGHIQDNKHSPADYLAAAGLADMVTNILVIPPLAFNQSLNALVSQAVGADNKKLAGVWLQHSVFWLTIGYLPCLVLFFYVGEILAMLGFSPELCELAGTYAKFNVLWPIPNGWYQCMRFFFQAQGVSRPAMYNNIFFLGVNALLNWILVFGGPFQWQGLGFIGAACSLSLSRSLQPLFYWLYMFGYRGKESIVVDCTPPKGFLSMAFLTKDRVKKFMDQSLPQIGTLIFQAVIGQFTTLLIAQLGALAIAASSAAVAVTQIFTGGISATLCAVCGIRVGYHLGEGDGEHARRASWMIFEFSVETVLVVSAILLPFAHTIMSIMTVDPDVQDLGAKILPAIMLNTLAGLIVECNTGGVFTSQGRTKLATFLSMGVELPLTIGIVAALVLVFHQTLVPVYWGQAGVMCVEAVMVMVLFLKSDWAQYVEDAKVRQEMASPGISRSASLTSSPAAKLGMTEVCYEPAGPTQEMDIEDVK